MRDVARIFPFCDKLALCWRNFPDLRFIQMLNLLLEADESGTDPFFWEEEKWLELIKKTEEKYKSN